MSHTVRLATLPLALVLLASGCGGGDEEPAATPTDAATTASASASATAGTATPSTPASTSTSTTPTTAGTDGCSVAAGAVPDGTWEGPIALDVRGTTNDAGQGYGDSRGTGRMRLVVTDGTITRGTWNVTWRSVGQASSGGAKATVRVTGTISGSVRGPARKPVLPGTWRLKGKVTITEPVQSSGPIDETGTDSETMKVTDATCSAVTGTFLPSFNSKDTLATFGGTATWTGTKVSPEAS